MRFLCVGASLLTICIAAGSASAQTDQAARSTAVAPPAGADADTAVAPPADTAPADAAPQPPRRKGKGKGKKRGGSAEKVADGGGDVVVTGSRLSNGDPTTHVIVIDRKQIESSGVTSVEDLIRTLPQNVATIGAITNSRKNGPLTADPKSTVSAVGSLGVSAANLGGLGAGNTLVLVNGRRLAGAAGIVDGFVNLNGIPLSAIERVEISQNGASAVYGADAMGGVINFILKKNYNGLTVTGQIEKSNNGADRLRGNAYWGKAWGSGSLSLGVAYDKTQPIVNAKTGYVTQNYSSYFGGNPTYDLRNFGRGLQPGVIDISAGSFDPTTGQYVNVVQGLTPRPGLTGRPGIGDFVTIGKDAARDYITKYGGPTSESISGTFNFEQNITSHLKVFANGLVTRTTNSQSQDLAQGIVMNLAPGQYYNPFPAYRFATYNPAAPVNYFPAAEIADGSLIPGTLRNRTTQWSVNAGVNYDFNRTTHLSIAYTTSRATTVGNGQIFGAFPQIVADPKSPTGYSCSDFVLANPQYSQLTPAGLAARQAAFNKQCAALTSSDPNVAFNPWRTGTFAGGGSVQDFVYNDDTQNLGSRLQLIEARLNGNLLNLPAGPIAYSVGGEYATDGVSSPNINLFTGTAQSRDRHAFFGEVNLPIFGGDYTLPLMNALIFNIAGRNDTYKTTGAVGTVGNVPYTNGGQLIVRTNTFSRFTPAWGFQWKPISAIAILGRWTTGFKAPPATQLFSPAGTTTYQSLIFNDPVYRCTTDCVINNATSYAYSAPQVVGSNPNLRPQTSKQQTFSFLLNPRGALDRLSLVVTYNHTRIDNEYATSRDLQTYLTQQQILAMPLFYPRGANGKVTSFNNTTFNIVGSDFKSITYEANYFIPTGIGQFQPALVVVQNITSSRQVLPGTPAVDTVGTIGGPDRFRVNGRLTWTRGTVTATVLGYYTPSYVNDYFAYRAAGVITNPAALQHVSPYTTFDLTASWQATERAKLSFTSRNIFDAKPPFTVVDSLPYDTARYNVAGRTVALQLAYSF